MESQERRLESSEARHFVGGGGPMKSNYDLKKLKWKPNPYVRLLKKPVTIRLDEDVLSYFKELGQKERMPYQTVINQFLR